MTQPIELPLPSNIEYCHVQMFIMKAVGDGGDEDNLPDGVAYAGARVTMKAKHEYVRNSEAIPRPAIIALTEIKCEVDGGGVLRYKDRDTGNMSSLDGVYIIAGNSASTNPTMWPYDVTIDHPTSDLFIQFSFIAEAGKTIDLATVIPVPSSPGTEIEAWLEAVNTVQTARDEIVQTVGNIGTVYQMVTVAAAAAVTPVAAPVTWTGGVVLTNAQLVNTVIHATLTGNVTLTLPAGTAGQAYACQLMLTQDATAAIRTVTVTGASVRKQWNYDPPLSTKPNATDMVTLFWDGYFWNVGVGLVSLGVA